MTWSVRDALRGRRLLVTGATGFLGKVWLGHLLEALPELGRLHLVVRPARGPGDAAARATRRLEELLATSPAFWPLHERGLARGLGARLEAVAGDVERPALGLDAATLERLAGQVEAVVHLAGLTDLEPSLEDALAANVDGAVHALDVARRLGAALVHVSTCYVAGARRGRLPEALHPGAPRERDLDLAREEADLRALARRAREELGDGAVERAVEDAAAAAMDRQGLRATDPERPRFVARERDRWLRGRIDGPAGARARARGWPNVYTMTKALAEARVAREAGDVRWMIVRPAIVESAEVAPLPGWKEGLETSGPLTWAMARGPLRSLPARPELVLDVVPVDHVARGLTLATAALLAGRAPSVMHLGTSDEQPLPLARAVDLTALAHRKLEGRDRGPLDAKALLAPDAAPAGDLLYRATSVPALRGLARAARGALDLAAGLLPGAAGERAGALARSVDRTERALSDLEATVERFRPFVLENDCTFATDGAAALTAALEPGERALFGFAPRALDWRGYWLDVHVPGLRRWVWPLLEGRRVERGPRREVRLVDEPRPARLPAAP